MNPGGGPPGNPKELFWGGGEINRGEWVRRCGMGQSVRQSLKGGLAAAHTHTHAHTPRNRDNKSCRHQPKTSQPYTHTHTTPHAAHARTHLGTQAADRGADPSSFLPSSPASPPPPLGLVRRTSCCSCCSCRCSLVCPSSSVPPPESAAAKRLVAVLFWKMDGTKRSSKRSVWMCVSLGWADGHSTSCYIIDRSMSIRPSSGGTHVGKRGAAGFRSRPSDRPRLF